MSYSIDRRKFLEKSVLVAEWAGPSPRHGRRGAAGPAPALNNTPASWRSPFASASSASASAVRADGAAAAIPASRSWPSPTATRATSTAPGLITPAPQTTGDYKAILARPASTRVVIATPDHWHLRMTQDALPPASTSTARSR